MIIKMNWLQHGGFLDLGMNTERCWCKQLYVIDHFTARNTNVYFIDKILNEVKRFVL